MANVTLQNNRLGDLIVGDVTVPRDGGTAEIDSEALKEAKKNKAVETWFKNGWLTTVKGERASNPGGGSGNSGGSGGGSGQGSGGNSGGGSGS